MKTLSEHEILRVISYAYTNDYEPDECVKLLFSKGIQTETYESIDKFYKLMNKAY